MQSNTTEWNTNHFYFLNNLTLIVRFRTSGHKLASERSDYVWYSPPGEFQRLVLPCDLERPASKHDGRCASLDFLHKWTEIEKKKVGSGHFLGEILSVQKIEPRMSTGENWSEKKIFHSLDAL